MATRSKRFLSGMTAGYANIACNIVFTLVSIPLALHYLDKETFGLWALAIQINGYLNLIDFGMSGAVSRFVADHKDDVNGGEYGSHILTGALVFLIQGILIAAVGAVFSWFAPAAFGIADHLAGDFRLLLLILCLSTGTSVALRAVSSPLWAFQRNDVTNGSSAAALLLNLLLLWLAFRAGWGVIGLALASIPGIFATMAFYAFVCWRNGYYPKRGCWGRPSKEIFRKTFGFGKDVLLINLGRQLINASQIMIVSRSIGLEAAAAFSIGMKFYTMAMLLVQNPISASASGLAELHVRGEHKRFVNRYFDMFAVVLAFATLAACGLVTGNRFIIDLWTHGKIEWSWTRDLLLGALIIARNANGYLLGLFGLVKNWQPVRHLYLLEGITFVPIAVLAAKAFGIEGVLAASLAVHLATSTMFAARAARKIIGPLNRISRKVAAAVLIVLAAWALGGVADLALSDSFASLLLAACVGILGSITVWMLILPDDLKNETCARALRIAAMCKIRRC